jgi:hypothetical protein
VAANGELGQRRLGLARFRRHGEEGGDWSGLERPVLAGEDGKDVD